MIIITGISYFLCLLYIMLLLFFAIAWKRTKIFENDSVTYNDSAVFVSLVIAVKDEAENLPALFLSLNNQTFRNFELVIVNDHSTDDSLAVLSEFAKDKKNIRIVNAFQKGKKNALREGISASSGELIICTDADCRPNEDWLKTVVKFYSANLPDLIIAPVKMIHDSTIFGQMQALEFMSLQASTAGAACGNRAIMCNGANFAFTRKAWDENNVNLKNEKLSGDDMFLMMSIKRHEGKILYLKSDKAFVYTSACNTFREFFNQRKRWVSKSPAYFDKDIISAALIVLGVSFVIILNLVLAIFVSTSYWIPFVIIFLTKMIIDGYFLSLYASFAKSNRLLKLIFPLSLVYPFYVLHITVSGIFGNFEWKGRKQEK